MRSNQTARDRADQKRGYQLGINVAKPPVKQAGYASKQHGMHNVGTDHDLGSKAVKHEQQHHDNAARAHRGHADQEPGQ